MSRHRYVRRRRRSHVRRWLVIAVAAIALLQAALLTRHHRQAGAPAITTAQVRTFPPITQTGTFREFSRALYPLSVIRGGAYTAEEANTAIDTDPVVANHYAVFRRALLTTVRSPFTDPVYVSYRRANNIYWTRRPIALHERETLLTDGVSYARARCGNRISLAKQLPVSEEEPAPDVLDRPESPPAALIEATLFPASDSLLFALERRPDGVLQPKALTSSATLNRYMDSVWPRVALVFPSPQAVVVTPPSPFFPAVLQLPALWPVPASVAYTSQPPVSPGFQNTGYISPPGIIGSSVLEISPLPFPVITTPEFNDSSVPEPRSFLLLAVGTAALVGLIVSRRAFTSRR